MKKTLAILTVVGVAAAAFAQGTFQWSAPGTTLLGQTNSTSYSSFETSSGNPSPSGTGLASGGGTFPLYYELLTSSALTSLTSVSQLSGSLSTAWLDTGLGMTNSAANNGRISPIGGAQTAAAANSNWASGSTQNAILVGWSANLGTSWATVVSELQNWSTASQSVVGTAWFGISSVATGLDPSTANPGITVVGAGGITGLVNLQPLGVAATPEPTTVALAGLGGLALLGLRRKK